jgi:hypothetical protein
MPYYLYISDAKVDMLLPQVPGALKQKVAAKLGFDLKVLAGEIATERNTLDTQIARLQTVESFIRETETLGTPASAESWIAGEEWASTAHIGDGAILFVIEDPKWMLALGGSSHHLIGGTRAADVGIPFSFLDRLIRQLKHVAEQRPELAIKLTDRDLAHYMAPGVGQEFGAWISVIQWVADHSSGPPQRIEFLAKRLVSQTSFGRRVTLATPLYVALTS